jgi:hypothetical protein
MRYLSVCSGIEAATVAWHPLGWKPVAWQVGIDVPRQPALQSVGEQHGGELHGMDRRTNRRTGGAMSDEEDIVTRLHRHRCVSGIRTVIDDAADEIERLRKALDEISKMKNDEPYCAQHAIDALEQQREAL